MGLIEKLLRLEEPSLAIHMVVGLLAEQERGRITAAQALSAINAELARSIVGGVPGGPLTAGEVTKLEALAARVTSAQLETISLGGTVVLTNVGTTYDAIPVSKGLGFIRIQTAGVTGFEWAVRWERVQGAGATLSWQLWNETNSAEIARIDDTGAAGTKEQSIVQAITPGPGIRTIRVRAKSTTLTDDPIYHGSCLIVRRLERLSPIEVKEILLLGNAQIEGYNTVPLIEARLGL